MPTHKATPTVVSRFLRRKRFHHSKQYGTAIRGCYGRTEGYWVTGRHGPTEVRYEDGNLHVDPERRDVWLRRYKDALEERYSVTPITGGANWLWLVVESCERG